MISLENGSLKSARDTIDVCISQEHILNSHPMPEHISPNLLASMLLGGTNVGC